MTFILKDVVSIFCISNSNSVVCFNSFKENKIAVNKKIHKVATNQMESDEGIYVFVINSLGQLEKKQKFNIFNASIAEKSFERSYKKYFLKNFKTNKNIKNNSNNNFYYVGIAVISEEKTKNSLVFYTNSKQTFIQSSGKIKDKICKYYAKKSIQLYNNEKIESFLDFILKENFQEKGILIYNELYKNKNSYIYQ